MKRIIGISWVFGIVVLTLTGCATKGFVRSEVDPVMDRLSKLEAQVNSLSSKVGQTGGSTEADRAAIQLATDKAQQALDTANKLAGQMKQSEEGFQRAEAAASRAETAAKEAEDAAKEAKKVEGKSEKIFKLEQKK